ncbi:MAG: galactokinase, partial [Anaerolineales bacterium]
MNLYERVQRAFQVRFRSQPDFVVRAPGRVNLIGEHTDYNDGFVLPMAIEHAVWIALRPRRDQQVLIHSLDYEQTVSFSVEGFRRGKKRWGEYIKGVARALQQQGYPLTGWEGVMCGNVPIGAGLSSSAATEMAAASAFAAAGEFEIPPREMALAGQWAENAWVGVHCGIMDQMVSAAAREGHALFLDCRTLETEDVPMPDGVAVVIMDTSTRRGLVGTAYNERRAQCEAAARHFGVQALRDVSPEWLANGSAGLDDVTLRRARHVVTENQRVLEAVQAMRQGD